MPPLTFPFDPDVRVGKLDNGLTYYIRGNANHQTAPTCGWRLTPRSVLENEDQMGLAHFLEHMLFNGTKNFPGQELINYLESIGMRFGPDVNASTSFDETVYTLQVPTDDKEKLQKAFDVLADWTRRATISPEEVDAERGVIVEEWRMRDLNASGRVNDEMVEALLGGSRMPSACRSATWRSSARPLPIRYATSMKLGTGPTTWRSSPSVTLPTWTR